MLRILFRALSSQSNQKTAIAPRAAKRIDPALLNLAAGGAPRGGWIEPESAMGQAPRGGWIEPASAMGQAPRGGWY